MSEREDWINLIRNEYNPKPDLGRGSYPAFDSEWDDGAGRIADAILADKTILLRRRSHGVSGAARAMSDKLTQTGAYSKDIERKMMEVADMIAATLDQPADMRAWEHLLIYCPRDILEQCSTNERSA